MLNELNLDLQGKDKTIVDMISVVETFKHKLKLVSSQLHQHALNNFRIMMSELENQGKQMFKILYLEWPHYLTWIHLKLKIRLSNSKMIYRSNPSQQEAVCGTFSMKKSILMSGNVPCSYLTFFIYSSYLCEWTFSHLQYIKFKHRSTLSHEHLDAGLRLSITSHTKLAHTMQCQSSH